MYEKSSFDDYLNKALKAWEYAEFEDTLYFVKEALKCNPKDVEAGLLFEMASLYNAESDIGETTNKFKQAYNSLNVGIDEAKFFDYVEQYIIFLYSESSDIAIEFKKKKKQFGYKDTAEFVNEISSAVEALTWFRDVFEKRGMTDKGSYYPEILLGLSICYSVMFEKSKYITSYDGEDCDEIKWNIKGSLPDLFDEVNETLKRIKPDCKIPKVSNGKRRKFMKN